MHLFHSKSSKVAGFSLIVYLDHGSLIAFFIVIIICRKEHSSLAEELQHLKDSLLRDTNREMDQQRVIDKMKAERRETICVQAHQRQELERDLCEAEKKVSSSEFSEC